MMIPVNFVHESLPAGGFRVNIPAVPNRKDLVRLNNENFVVTAVAHALDKGLESYYVAFVYLELANIYFKDYGNPGLRQSPRS